MTERYSLKNKVILVTGGTGSFGNAFVTYALEHLSPKKIIVYSQIGRASCRERVCLYV